MAADHPFVCATCGAPLALPQDPNVFDVGCTFCKARTPVPQQYLQRFRQPPAPVAPFGRPPAQGSVPGGGQGAILAVVIVAITGVAMAAGVAMSVTRRHAAAVATVPTAVSPPEPAPSAAPVKPKKDTTGATDFAKIVKSFGGKGTGPGLFTDPRLITVDRDGEVFVGEYSTGRVQKFDASGSFVQIINVPPKEGRTPLIFGLAADFAGNLYVSRSHEVLKLSTKDGSLLSTIKERPRANGQHASPSELCAREIAVDASNRLYVASDCTPNGLSVDIEDPHSVVKLDGAGKVLWRAKGAGSQFQTSIAIDGLGTVFLGDALEHNVQVFDATGKFTNKWGQRGNDPGDFQFGPRGLAFDGVGHLFALDRAVLVFEPTGKYRGQFGKGGRAIAMGPKPTEVYVLDGDMVQQWEVTLPAH